MKKVIIMPHMHWDREWYFTEKTYKDRLVRVFDKVLECLGKHKEFCFQMDGQIAIVIDYLSRRPKNREKIKKFVKEKRLFIGPSFVLPDEFLATGESLIRNIEHGIEKAKELGGYYKVSYCPDTFGHTGQLPQILKQFGFVNTCLWRGIPNDASEFRDFVWVGDDKTSINCYRFDRTFNIGYSNCWRLKKEGDKFFVLQGGNFKSLEEVLNSEFDKSCTETVVLMNGSDHTALQEDIVDLVKELNKKYNDIKFVFGSFEDYFRNIKKSGCVSQLLFGELNKGTETTFLLNGTFSTRIREVKQPYNECNKKLLRAEFLQTLAHRLTRARYDKEALNEAWEYLLLNMPHDSLCGCSVDRVHEDMTYRFNQVKDIAEKLIDNAASIIADKADTTFIADGSLAFVVLNDSNFERGIIKTKIKIPPDFGNFVIYDNKGNKVNYQILSKTSEYNIEERVTKEGSQLFLPKSESIELIVEGKIPAFGYSSFEVRRAGKEEKNNNKIPLKVIKNKNMSVEINLNGTLTIKDLKTGAIYSNCNLFFDTADRGDEYTYSPITDDFFVSQGSFAKITTLFDNRIGSSVKIEYDLSLPKSLTKGRDKRSSKMVKCSLTSIVTLFNDSNRLDIVTEFENKAKDHRLRVVFPTYLKSDCSYAAAHFGIVGREAKGGDSSLDCRMEVSSNSYCHQGFFAMHDGEKGLGVIAKGLPEYEVVKDKDSTVSGQLALLRSIGWLSRDDLLTRKGLAGPAVETLNAQQLGNHKFEYSIVLLGGQDWASELYKAKEDVEILSSAVTGKHKGNLAENYKLIEIPTNLQYSSLRLENGKTLLRVYNPTSEVVCFGQGFLSKAVKVDLNGKKLEYKSNSLESNKFLTIILE